MQMWWTSRFAGEALALVGRDGVGKTALARRFVSWVRTSSPPSGGVLWWSARQSQSQLVDHLARLLGGSEGPLAGQDDVERLAMDLRRRLEMSSGDHFVVLDDMDSGFTSRNWLATLLRALLATPHRVAVLIVARTAPYDIHGSQRGHTVEPLAIADSVELLRQLGVPDERVGGDFNEDFSEGFSIGERALDLLAKHSAGLPLAIHGLAKQVRESGLERVLVQLRGDNEPRERGPSSAS
jgi:hypothetical protein